MIRNLVQIFLIPVYLNCQSLDEQLKNVERLGSYLFQYKKACNAASDSLNAAKYDLSSVNSHYGYKENGNWKVGFGRYGESSDEYLISYEVIYNPTTGKCLINSFETPMKERAFYCHASKMERVLSKMLDPVNNPYIYAIIPVDSTTWYMYALPEQTDQNIYRLGGDTRFTIHWLDNQITAIRKLHKSIMLMPFKNNSSQLTISSAQLFPYPVESDILYVLSREFKGVHKIITKEYTFTINNKGEITKMPFNDN